MKKLATKGFTLIELLVVITIIGILATGATAVYTSAQQKARDSIRQNDVLALRSAVEQAFGDNALYPSVDTIGSDVVGEGYMQSFPKDPKSGQSDAKTNFDYIYASAQDEVTKVKGQEYEVSANFENTGNAESKEVNTADGGNDLIRWEIGVNMDNINTCTGNADCGSSTSSAAETITAGTGTVTSTNDYASDDLTVNAVFINAVTPVS